MLKVELDCGVCEIPDVVREDLERIWKEATVEEPEWGHQFKDVGELIAQDLWELEGWDEYRKGWIEKRIVPEEVAKFLIDETVLRVPAEGGYPVEKWFVFEDNGYRYSICYFGWPGEEYDRGEYIGYKDKIELGELIKEEECGRK
jgi:hypothetical protein